jgi:propionyl-CoA carboxylase alpha chain
MGEVACSLGREVAYTNAGTVEFILDDANNFYFLEMNTRLQVEHPITELVTSLDLVELQIRIAAGERLPLKQEEIVLKGWSIEARVCAEDPSRGFLPTTGIISRYALPSERNVRIDSGIAAGSVITIYYDSLLAKVAAWGEDRSAAIGSLVSALNGFHIEGVITNIDFLNAIVNHPAFAEGDLSTDFIEEHFTNGRSNSPLDPQKIQYMAIAAVLVYHTRQGLVRDSLRPMSPLVGRSSNSSGHYNYIVRIESDLLDLRLEGDQVKRHWTIRVNSKPHSVVTPEFEYYRRRLSLKINGVRHIFRLKYDENHIRVSFCGINRVCEIYTPREWNLAHFMLQGEKAAQENVLKCPMPGMITSIDVEEGAHVRKGQELVRMESMKMETGVAAPIDGQVDKILVQAGQTVETDQVLITFNINSLSNK